MALGLPTPPPGGGGGGGGLVGTIGRNILGGNYSTPQPSAQQQAALNWLQSSAGLNYSNYNSNLNALAAERNAALAAAGAGSAAAGRDYALTMRGIDQDLLYGGQLREQEKYRNVDLGRQRSASDWRYAQGSWDILKNDLGARKNYANEGFGLANRQTNLQYNTGMRGLASDAVARGARTAGGTIAQSGDLVEGRGIGLAGNRLDLKQALNAINTQYKQGAAQYNKASRDYGLDQKTFNSIAMTYGIQAAQAAAQAALARDRAASNRASASAGSGAARARALAGYGAAANQAQQQYAQQQMALYGQLFGL